METANLLVNVLFYERGGNHVLAKQILKLFGTKKWGRQSTKVRNNQTTGHLAAIPYKSNFVDFCVNISYWYKI